MLTRLPFALRFHDSHSYGIQTRLMRCPFRVLAVWKRLAVIG